MEVVTCILFLIFLEKREPIPRVFVGGKKSLREMPPTAHITFLRCPLSTVKTRLENSSPGDTPKWPI